MLCTATVEDRVPPFMKGKGSGWVTAEYSMLPRSGRQRNQRDLMKPNGRTMEIQRLIGRSMRTVVDMEALGERTITLDCDALQADGGTRCAAITGSYVALMDAIKWMQTQRMLKMAVRVEPVAAISVGVVQGREVLDLDYKEDSSAETDMNIVMTQGGKFVEIQGTAEREAFGPETLLRMLNLGRKGVNELIALQKQTLEA